MKSKKAWSEDHQKATRLQEKITSIKDHSQSLRNMWQEKNSKVADLKAEVKTLDTMRHEMSSKISFFESEIKTKNQRIKDLLQAIQNMKLQDDPEKDAIIDTAVQGMKGPFL